MNEISRSPLRGGVKGLAIAFGILAVVPLVSSAGPGDAVGDATAATDGSTLESTWSEIDLSRKRWNLAVANHIAAHWFRPPKLPKDLRCKVEIRIDPAGRVQGVKMLERSGTSVFDASVENAIYKADPLPLPDRGDAFQDTLTSVFTP